MRHEQFAERLAGRLEEEADRLEDQGRRLGFGERVAARARELRIAACIARDEAASVSREEAARHAALRH